MKEKLEELFNENKDRYKELIKKVTEENTKEVWTIGLGNPFEVIPFYHELYGVNIGRIMKQNGKPSKNRYCNYITLENKVIYSKFYSNFNDIYNEWYVNEHIYIYNKDSIIRLTFRGLENIGVKEMCTVVYTELLDNKAIKTVRLDSDDEAIEKEYIYEGDKIIEINTNWLSGSFMGYSRKFKIYYENDNVRITSISKNGEKQIYPEK